MSVTMEQVLAVLNPDEPDYAQARALGPAALPLLARIVHGTDPMLAAKAASAAGVIGGPDALSVLEEAARSPVSAVRVSAAAAVGELAAPLGAAVLIHLLSDQDRGVRRLALRSAAGRADLALRARIEVLSTSDGDPRVRAEAAEMLRRQ